MYSTYLIIYIETYKAQLKYNKQKAIHGSL